MLKVENSYMDKEGVNIPLKSPKMALQGKLMDDGEQHRLVVLSREGIKTWTGNPVTFLDKKTNQQVTKVIPTHQLFVKYPNEQTAFNLNLSAQAKNAIEKANPFQGDEIILTKYWYDADDGSKKPCVGVEVIRKSSNNNNPNSTPNNNDVTKNGAGYELASIEEINKFLISYTKQVIVTERNLTHLFMVWFKNKYRSEADKLLPTFKAYLEKGHTQVPEEESELSV